MSMGFHIIASLKGCTQAEVRTLHQLNHLLNDTVRDADFHKVGELSSRINRHTPTSFVLLAESHISIYTDPKSGNAELDIFCCSGEDSARLALHMLIAKLMPVSFTSREIRR